MSGTQKSKIDMTTGHIMKNIILFAIPIIIGNVLQQLYGAPHLTCPDSRYLIHLQPML